MSKIYHLALFVLAFIHVSCAPLSGNCMRRELKQLSILLNQAGLSEQLESNLMQYITELKRSHDQLARNFFLLEQKKKNSARCWEKKQEFTTESLPEFMSTAEQVQQELGCKVDVQEHTKRSGDNTIQRAHVCSDGTIAIVAQDSGKQICNLGYAPQTSSTVFSKCGKFFALADSTSIKLWDTESYKLIYEVACDAHKITFSADAAYLASMNADGIVEVRDTHTGQIISGFDNGQETNLFAFSRDNKYMICRSDLWQTHDSQNPYSLTVWEHKK